MVPEVFSAKLKKTGTYSFNVRCQQAGSNMDLRGTNCNQFQVRSIWSFKYSHNPMPQDNFRFFSSFPQK